MAVYFYVFKRFVVPLLGTLGWDREIAQRDKNVTQKRGMRSFGGLRGAETQKERISYLHR